MLSIVVAKGKNNIIGNENKLIWSLPADMKRFKELTTGHVIIMGRKTFESLGKVLPNRKHIVFTQNPDFMIKDENVQVVHSMLEIKEYIDKLKAFPNIIVKFGRYIPNHEKHFDEVLGIYLASDNQYAERIS